MLKKSYYYAQKVPLLCSEFFPWMTHFFTVVVFRHFGNWNINESQTPSRPTWPRPFPVVKGSLSSSLLSRIFLHRKSGIPISRFYLTPMYLFIFDILTYFREFFLLLCWHNARCRDSSLLC